MLQSMSFSSLFDLVALHVEIDSAIHERCFEGEMVVDVATRLLWTEPLGGLVPRPRRWSLRVRFRHRGPFDVADSVLSRKNAFCAATDEGGAERAARIADRDHLAQKMS